MPPIIHLIRHAQGYHNLSTANHAMHDPLLTPYGRQQCTHLQEVFPYAQDVDLIIASPLKRTIYTALYSFDKKITSKDMTIITLPEIQETSDLPCDTGSDLAELEHEFAGKKIDFKLVQEGWNSKKGKWAPTTKEVEERAKYARHWLRERKEEHIVVVTHGGVLHYLTEDWAGFEGFMGTGWTNTEFRTYEFDPAKSDSASLKETDESCTRRRGAEKPLTEAENRNLKRVATIDAEKASYNKGAMQTSNMAKAQAKV